MAALFFRGWISHALNVRGPVAVRAAGLLAATALLCAAIVPAASATSAASTVRQDLAKLGLTVPASARTRGTTPTSTPAPTTTANGAQPGTVAPGATVGGGSVPTTTAPATGPTGTAGTGSTSVPATGGAITTPTVSAPGSAAARGDLLGISHHKPRRSSGRLSTTAIVLAAIGALLLLACLIWAAARWLALQPRWGGSIVYSLREASYHASATWAEFSDWARIGH